MSDPAERMISVIEHASVDPEVNPEKMRQLLDIQLVIMDRQAKIEFDSAMADCQAEMSNLKIIKTADNTQTNSSYAKHEVICATIKPIYTKHGFRLSFSEGKSDSEGEIRTHCTVTHRSGHSEPYWIDFPADLAGIKGQVNKTPIHAKGSTFSYGRRYLTLMIFDLATYDDNDANRPPVERLTEEHVANIKALIEEVGADKEGYLKYLKVSDISEIPENAYKEAVRLLEVKRKAKK